MIIEFMIFSLTATECWIASSKSLMSLYNSRASRTIGHQYNVSCEIIFRLLSQKNSRCFYFQDFYRRISIDLLIPRDTCENCSQKLLKIYGVKKMMLESCSFCLSEAGLAGQIGVKSRSVCRQDDVSYRDKKFVSTKWLKSRALREIVIYEPRRKSRVAMASSSVGTLTITVRGQFDHTAPPLAP